MILALDIGNSAAKAALFDGPRIVRATRLAAVDDVILRLFVDDLAVTRVGIASVVPEETAVALAASGAIASQAAVVVGPDLPLPFEMAYRTPESLGADRLAAAAGAVALYPGADPVVVIDAGTAVTCEVVASGAYLGGAIGPGPDLLHRALSTGTAQLPEIPSEMPDVAIGRSTREALQVGVMLGLIDSVGGLLARLATELRLRPLVIATGGWAPLLAQHVSAIDHVEPHLVLHGVRALVEGVMASEQPG